MGIPLGRCADRQQAMRVLRHRAADYVPPNHTVVEYCVAQGEDGLWIGTIRSQRSHHEASPHEQLRQQATDEAAAAETTMGEHLLELLDDVDDDLLELDGPLLVRRAREAAVVAWLLFGGLVVPLKLAIWIFQ